MTQNDLAAVECSVLVVLNELVFRELRLLLAVVNPPTVSLQLLLADPVISEDDARLLLFAAAAAAACLSRFASSADESESLSDIVPISESKWSWNLFGFTLNSFIS